MIPSMNKDCLLVTLMSFLKETKKELKTENFIEITRKITRVFYDAIGEKSFLGFPYL